MLYVQMLGNFYLKYEDRVFVLDGSIHSKTTQLFQLLMLHLKGGISKEKLLGELYGRDQVENRNASLNNTIFRLRRRLGAAGLPKSWYIIQKEGMYYWDPEIPVEVDVHRFEEKMQEAENCHDRQQRTERLQKALALYKGEFLPNMIGEDWAAVANIYYRELYIGGVTEVCSYWKEQEDYETVLETATEAARIYPFDEWYFYQIDSLIALNRYQEAMDIYKKTVKVFLDELGLPPSEELLARFNYMSGRISQNVSAIEEIKGSLREKESPKGAYYCAFPSFVDAYHIVSRMMERLDVSTFIVLCTLTNARGEIRQGSKKNKEAAKSLKSAIRDSLRKGDFYTRYNESQYLVLVTKAQEENCSDIFKRIEKRFREEYKGSFKIQYYVATVTEIQNEEER